MINSECVVMCNLMFFAPTKKTGSVHRVQEKFNTLQFLFLTFRLLKTECQKWSGKPKGDFFKETPREYTGLSTLESISESAAECKRNEWKRIREITGNVRGTHQVPGAIMRD